MNRKVKALCAAGLFFAAAAQAYQADITVTSTIDPTAGITLSDSTPLPKTVDMAYSPGVGLHAYRADVKFWTNADLDMNIHLANTPQLSDAAGAVNIPLTVTLDGKELTSTDQLLSFNTLFPTGKVENGSNVIPLVIKQKNSTQAVNAGTYSGMVSLVISQATTKNGVAPTPAGGGGGGTGN